MQKLRNQRALRGEGRKTTSPAASSPRDADNHPSTALFLTRSPACQCSLVSLALCGLSCCHTVSEERVGQDIDVGSGLLGGGNQTTKKHVRCLRTWCTVAIDGEREVRFGSFHLFSRMNLFVLPNVVQRRVFSCMDIPELFLMSLCSSKTRHGIKEVKFRKNLQLEFSLVSSKCHIGLCQEGLPPAVTWMFDSVEESTEDLLNSRMTILSQSPLCVHCPVTPIRAREYLQNLLGHQIPLFFWVGNTAAHNRNFIKHVGDIDHLAVIGKAENVDSEGVEQLLNLHEQNIKMITVETPGLTFNDNCKLFYCAELRFLHSKGEHLRMFRGNRTVFIDADCDEQDVIFAIRRWLESRDNMLQEVIVNRSNSQQFDSRMILDEFETKPWDPEVRSAVYVNTYKRSSVASNKNYSEGRDIERADGLLATIQLVQGLFVLAVWHSRFPE